eukprot:9404111-Prorocentrum_lima.AAC.1
MTSSLVGSEMCIRDRFKDMQEYTENIKTCSGVATKWANVLSMHSQHRTNTYCSVWTSLPPVSKE